MCIRDSTSSHSHGGGPCQNEFETVINKDRKEIVYCEQCYNCLLYTSDAADERSSVDLGGRRIIKKKKTN